MRKFVSLLSLLCLLVQFSFAQSDKKVVAIMPFLSAQPTNRPQAAQLQSIALQVFTAMPNAEFIDRSADPLVLKELDNQTRGQSISSQTLVEQGKLSGSQEIIVGTLSSISVEERRVNGIISSFSSDIKYIANISYSLQVIDAATGILISSKDFNGSTKTQDIGNKVLGATKSVLGRATSVLMADTKDEAIRKAIQATKQEIAGWISEAYPPQIKLLSIESRDKNGFPETVIISGLSAGKKIIVNEIVLIDDGNGGKLRRLKKVGELKVSEFQGQVTLCKVTEGEDVLEGKMNTGAHLEFVLK